MSSETQTVEWTSARSQEPGPFVDSSEIFDTVQAMVGRQDLPGTSMGRAKKLDHGFVTVLASHTGEILGCHVLGSEASTMIHEVVVAMRAGSGHVDDVADMIHVHPALDKAVQYAFEDAQESVE